MSPAYFSARDLERLRVLRGRLLSIEGRPAEAPAPRYWESERDLELYDATFARRIAWKWEAVQAALWERARLGATETVLDWGCGTGVASRSLLAGGLAARRVLLWDRDPRARAFAREKLASEHSRVEAIVLDRPPREPVDLLLASHVLDELSEEGERELLDLARGARRVVWVEPGSRASSRRLGRARERLRGEHLVLAPCTHQEACGMLTLAREADWCHFFARPAPEVFTEGRWAELGRELGIDLRSVPYSYLALARADLEPAPAPPPPGAARLLGRPRVQRGRALLDVCEAGGVRELVVLQRHDKALFRALGETAGEDWVLDLAGPHPRRERAAT